MEKLIYEIVVEASDEKTYKMMLNDTTYRQWTSEFNPTSFFRGTWEKDSEMLFVGCNEKGEEEGMFSRIAENIPNKFVSIQHLGMVSNGEIITQGEQVEKWAGIFENYTFTQEGDKTRVKVEMDSTGDYDDYFNEVWPRALNKLKEIVEN